MPSAIIIFAHVKYWLWKIGSAAFLAPIYIAIISEGLRLLIPPAGLRLSKIPFLDFFDDFEATHRLDCAHLMGLGMLVFVWFFWDQLLTIKMGAEFNAYGFDPEKYKKVVTILGSTLICCDACLFFLSVTNSSWAGSSFSFSAVLATAAYIAILVGVSFVSCLLGRDIRVQSTKESEKKV
jgi:hypothetical protein